MSQFTYVPITEEMAEKERQFQLLEPGVYNFQVIKATFKISKSNNPMIELQLMIWDDAGKEHIVYDYLVSSAKMMWKTIKFCKAAGLEEEYKQGKFNEELCENRSGKASIVYQAGQKKEDGTYYKDKNSVDDYIDAAQDTKQQDQSKGHAEAPFFDDPLPF